MASSTEEKEEDMEREELTEATDSPAKFHSPPTFQGCLRGLGHRGYWLSQPKTDEQKATKTWLY